MSIKKRLLLFFFFILVILTSTTSYILLKRSSIYPYQVDNDYKYSFTHSSAKTIDLKLKEGIILLPQNLDYTQQTFFIKIDLNTTFLGRYLLPSVKISDNNKTVTQYFEHGAKGIRYLNVSALFNNKTTQLTIKGKHISLNDQSIQLITFSNPKIKEKKVLIIAPHPDDAEIAAYGLYSNIKDTYIVTITAGDAGPRKYDEIYTDKVKQYFKKGEVRTWNSITVPLLAKVPAEHLLNLGFFDGTLYPMYQDKSLIASGHYIKTSDITTFRKQNFSTLSQGLTGKSNWDSLVKNLEYLLQTIEPDVIVTPYPKLDAHHDHKLSTIAIIEAIKNINLKKGALYLYTNHLVLNHYYPYGKMGGVISLPPSFKEHLYFDSIYSHTLSADDQKDKILAFDAMSDLRPNTEWRFTQSAIKHAQDNIHRDIMGDENSYYKRAVRDNELFFVIDIPNLYNKEVLKEIIGQL